LPSEAADRISSEITRAVSSPEMRARFAEVGADPVGTNVAGAMQFLRAEMAKWKQIVEVSGARAD